MCKSGRSTHPTSTRGATQANHLNSPLSQFLTTVAQTNPLLATAPTRGPTFQKLHHPHTPFHTRTAHPAPHQRARSAQNRPPPSRPRTRTRLPPRPLVPANLRYPGLCAKDRTIGTPSQHHVPNHIKSRTPITPFPPALCTGRTRIAFEHFCCRICVGFGD
jgi:hypothetical protein